MPQDVERFRLTQGRKTCYTPLIYERGAKAVDELDELVIPLLGWYRENRRDLPWRQPGPEGRPEAYRVWVSEIMLQQTRVAAVTDYYPPWRPWPRRMRIG